MRQIGRQPAQVLIGKDSWRLRLDEHDSFGFVGVRGLCQASPRHPTFESGSMEHVSPHTYMMLHQEHNHLRDFISSALSRMFGLCNNWYETTDFTIELLEQLQIFSIPANPFPISQIYFLKTSRKRLSESKKDCVPIP